MLVVNYNKTDGHIPQYWVDVTIKQAIAAAKIEPPDDIADSFDWFRHLNVVKQAYVALTDLDPEKIDPANLVHYFTKYLLKFIIDLQAAQPETYTPRLISEFTFNGTRYLMPTHLELGTNVVLMHNTKVKNFIEASNLLKQFSEMKKNGIDALPLMVASIVRESDNEVFDEARVVERGKAFEELTMNIGWEVFFCLSQLIIKFGTDTLQSMNAKRDTKAQRILERLDMKLGLFQQRKAELLEELRRLIK